MPMVNVPAGVVVAPSSPVGMKLVAVMLSRFFGILNFVSQGPGSLVFG
jgi:hypothetical protein